MRWNFFKKRAASVHPDVALWWNDANAEVAESVGAPDHADALAATVIGERLKQREHW